MKKLCRVIGMLALAFDIDLQNLTITISRVKGSRSGVQSLHRVHASRLVAHQNFFRRCFRSSDPFRVSLGPTQVDRPPARPCKSGLSSVDSIETASFDLLHPCLNRS